VIFCQSEVCAEQESCADYCCLFHSDEIAKLPLKHSTCSPTGHGAGAPPLLHSLIAEGAAGDFLLCDLAHTFARRRDQQSGHNALTQTEDRGAHDQPRRVSQHDGFELRTDARAATREEEFDLGARAPG
jgi:hypothetical protein